MNDDAGTEMSDRDFALLAWVKYFVATERKDLGVCEGSSNTGRAIPVSSYEASSEFARERRQWLCDELGGIPLDVSRWARDYALNWLLDQREAHLRRMLTPLYLSDLLTGLFAALAICEVKSLEVGALEDQFGTLINRDLPRYAHFANLRLCFSLRFPALADDLALAASNRIIRISSNRVFVEIAAQDANLYLKHVPGPPDMYVALARQLLRYVRAQSSEFRRPTAD
jgi:hypothetical protein